MTLHHRIVDEPAHMLLEEFDMFDKDRHLFLRRRGTVFAKEPRIAEHTATDHDHVATRRRSLSPRIVEIIYVAIAPDKRF